MRIVNCVHIQDVTHRDIAHSLPVIKGKNTDELIPINFLYNF